MTTLYNAQKLFIVEDNPAQSARLVGYLGKRFGSSLDVSVFTDGSNALEKIDKDTAIVVLDYDLKGEKAEILLKEIKKINPKTEVIILSSDEDIGTAIDAFRKGADHYVVKGGRSTLMLYSLIRRIVNYPVKILTERFGINKILAIFLTYFVLVGIIVYLGMLLLPSEM
ncbi:response regulator [Flavobacterium humi]|uniref:Response regulator n=1 Tax=Flavobacterium humi TaxID=2562683 RepID=A0A4Z0LB44_9FLAO|nr:response regulator [Flavobacterium humi]TGD59153.1 response regulator [Flavobacterium humi]